MSRSALVYASPSSLHRKQVVMIWKDSDFFPEVDWNAVEQDRGTTLTESCWETDDTSVICTDGPTISGSVTSVEVEACSAGTAELKNKATFADGSVAVCWWKITVKDDG